MNGYIAHQSQSLKSHLEGVAKLSRKNAEKIGCAGYGEILGLLHDIGKYGKNFQEYIKSAIGLLNPDDDDDFVDAVGLRGKIDHSTAGAQLLWNKLKKGTNPQRIIGQILSLCLVSHHSGLIDCLTTNSEGTIDTFSKRLNKLDEKTHFTECRDLLEPEIRYRIESIINDNKFTEQIVRKIENIVFKAPEMKPNSVVVQFQFALLTRFLFSCLIDADRQDSADSEKLFTQKYRQQGMYCPWSILISRLENELEQFKTERLIDTYRKDISNHCLNAATREKGLFTLTVPTGGGKTLASLRFALHHAKVHDLDRVIYVIPFTSIIDQNADVVRKILEPDDVLQEKGRIILEHHSNIGSEKQSWKEKLLTENWDAPVVYTTMVQLLETLFGAGTRDVRRMHQLAKAIIIFDEIQTLPIKCVHMFCNAINFLINQCGSSIVLCTATQPLLGNIDNLKGALSISNSNEIMPDIHKLFSDLKRVEVIDKRKPKGWKNEEIARMAIEEFEISGSCLIVVNMKKSARELFRIISDIKNEIKCYHLSTGMCPAHRKELLNAMQLRLKENLPTICISTQLIEAGIDIDFGCVIRFMAGLDSVAQAAGRCNRNGVRAFGHVYIVNPVEEDLDCLKDIAIGKDKTERVLNDFNEAPEKYNDDRIGPKLLCWYYQNYFYGQKSVMDYPISERLSGRTDTLLNLLSANSLATSAYGLAKGCLPEMFLRQSFMSAAEVFRSIDAPNHSVIVPYGDAGKEIINNLCSAFKVEKQFKLLRQAQQFTVNLFSNEFEKLINLKVLYPIQEKTEIYWLDGRYYSEQFGISYEPIKNDEVLYV